MSIEERLKAQPAQGQVGFLTSTWCLVEDPHNQYSIALVNLFGFDGLPGLLSLLLQAVVISALHQFFGTA